MGPPEMMLQAAAPAVRHLGIGQKPGEEAEVAEGDAIAGETCSLHAPMVSFSTRASAAMGEPARTIQAGLGEFLRAQSSSGKRKAGPR